MVALALEVRKQRVSIIASHQSRTKALRIEEPPAELDAGLQAWRNRDMS